MTIPSRYEGEHTRHEMTLLQDDAYRDHMAENAPRCGVCEELIAASDIEIVPHDEGGAWQFAWCPACKWSTDERIGG